MPRRQETANHLAYTVLEAAWTGSLLNVCLVVMVTVHSFGVDPLSECSVILVSL